MNTIESKSQLDIEADEFIKKLDGNMNPWTWSFEDSWKYESIRMREANEIYD